MKIKYSDLIEYRCDGCRKVEVPEGLYITEDDKELCADCVLNKYKTVAEFELKNNGGDCD